ncbi:MAG: hypothetical protein A2268_04525 [Candidatus Raymondbacteria bacterium RifOxyA12_full_50_37]|uniref:SbsA Ig-like domain-containing protein n=1 Tax=Candidatus Raymondbacteria bacterium RIFOXYD12_FULL_49_13 TaxID=1817890 RepID=A0A1F7FBE6_UNCRA|nr:MAG: hypothetical protein A2268_04525 [Candidatus Raymondbacteria bacterium RifOxyA12_full_50_37]OGJ88823.1 MAG: hypothetical protein A2350_01360 [Candidatus Raymondbacteria bacterium RifOxyB12_full_50_8]OGJ92515.1 MAG: hypothetical protein A2248_05425 [Candidatus Raymondbacteria bacterium RIFOXYA2_FULL_49_16]OGJ97741.1 MAG: hypothetical protein A2487_13350 [Candidatus Raymondbacteria bacterium RifOxyC12_full_50_8]OGJ97869.1 MAG: hypothetical protein A2453_02450 [Candidatus Raymondbacteria b
MKLALVLFMLSLFILPGAAQCGKSWVYIGKYTGDNDTVKLNLKDHISGFYSKSIKAVSITLRFWNPAVMDFGEEIAPAHINYSSDGMLVVTGVKKHKGKEYLLILNDVRTVAAN